MSDFVERELEFKVLHFMCADIAFYKRVPQGFFAHEDSNILYQWLSEYITKYSALPTLNTIEAGTKETGQLFFLEAYNLPGLTVADFNFFSTKLFENYLDRRIFDTGNLIVNGLSIKTGHDLRQEILERISGISNPFTAGGATSRGFVYENVLERWRKYVDREKNPEDNKDGILWGIRAMDEITPAVPGWLICLFAQAKEGKCLAGNTLLFDSNSGKPSRLADLVQSADTCTLDTLDTDTLRVKAKRVEARHDVGVKPVYKVTFRDGRTIECTDEHPFFADSLKWVPLKDIDVTNTRIALPRRLSIPKKRANISDSDIIILAYMLAEGNVATLAFTNTDAHIIERLRNAVSQRNYKLIPHAKNSITYHIACDRIKDHQIHGRKKALLKWFQSHDMIHTAGDKKIPEIVFTFNKNQLRLFIAALWECDGGWDGVYGCASRSIVEMLQYLLLRLGIWSCVKYDIPVDYDSNIKKKRFIHHRLFIRGGEYIKFSDALTPYMVYDEKRSKIKDNTNKLLAKRRRSTLDTIPWKTILQDVKWDDIRDSINYGKSYPKDRAKFLSRFKQVGRSVIRGLAVTKHSRLANSDILWMSIKSVDYIGNLPTYDLTMDRSNANFVANGVFAHNTRFMANLAFNQAYLNKEDVMWISREMSFRDMCLVFDSRLALVDQTDVRRGTLETDARNTFKKSLQYLEKAVPSLYIVDMPGQCRPVDVENELLMYYNKFGKFPKVCYFDYANLAEPNDGTWSNQSNKFDNVFRELHDVFRRTNVCGVTAVQEGRDGAKEKDKSKIGAEHIGLSHYIVPHVELMMHLYREEIDVMTHTMNCSVVAGRHTPKKSFSLFAFMNVNYIGDRRIGVQNE